MNYPYDMHNTSSESSRNQFMMSESSMINSALMMNNNNNTDNNEMEKIYSYMKNVMTNPMLMNEMQKFLALKQAQKSSSFIVKQNDSFSASRMEAEMRYPPESYVIQSNQHKKPEPLRINTQPNTKKTISPSMMQSNVNKKRSDEGLMAYINSQAMSESQVTDTIFQRPIAENIIKPQKKGMKSEQKPLPEPLKKPVPFDQIPIKSSYTAGQSLGNFDSAYPENSSQTYQKPSFKKGTNKTTASIQNNSNNNLEKYLELDERPISGTRKDFKDLLKQQFGQTPFEDRPLPTASNNSSNQWGQSNENFQQNQNEDDQNQDQRKPKKQFLKRGSRQYLSSAKEKKSVTKKSKEQISNKQSQQNLNNSRFGGDRTERDKTPTKRDVSQNRVLSKRNTTINEKSVSQLKMKEQSSNDPYYQQRQQEEEHKRSITPKNQRANQKTKSPFLPPKNSIAAGNIVGKPATSNNVNQGSLKKKNVFDDSSSSDGDKNRQQFDDEQDHQNSSRSNKLMNGKKDNRFGDKMVEFYQPQKEFNMFSRQKKQQIIEGVYLTKTQLNLILERHASKVQQSSSKNLNNSEQKFNQLRKKYTDLCKLLQQQKIQHEERMEKDHEEFQSYKQQEMQKIKNERRVMERQVKSSMPSQSQNLQKDKEQIQTLKKQLEKEKQEHKKKEKNNKILIEKYKKENEELKFRLQKLQEELQNPSSTSVQNNFSSTTSQRQSVHQTSSTRSQATNNDKSKSKVQNRDVSPGKAKPSKSSKAFDQNQEEIEQDKNYKKTVPLYKTGQQQKKQAGMNQNNKKVSTNGSKHFSDDHNSDDDNLPTFKVQNKKNEDNLKAGKAQKKYQYVENSVSPIQSKKQSQSTHSKSNSSNQLKQGSKNVFADDSDEQNDPQHQQENQDSDGETGHPSGFFKSQPKYEKLSDLMSSNFSIKDITPEMIEKLLKFENNEDYCKYLQRTNNPKRMIINSSKNGVDKKITNVYNDKSKEILFENGVRKEIFQDGYTIIYFKNGDIKQKLEDGTTLYYFKDKKVDQITLVNGLNIYRFDNNQVQVHYDGNKYIEIRHPDGTIKMLGSPVH